MSAESIHHCEKTDFILGTGKNLFAQCRRWKRWRRQLVSTLFRIPDRGLFGLTPVRTHILICGFPRSGTTLLQMMLENGIPEARRLGREVGAWRAATYIWRNHPVLISKVPQDIFRLEPVRDFYSLRPANLRIILMVRDPRDVLTSQRKFGGPDGYCVGAERWRKYFQAFLRHRNDPDVLVVRYEDLVCDPISQQQRIEAFTNETAFTPFSDFHSVARPDFDIETLNGVRPVEQSLISRWLQPEHRQRIQSMINAIEELAEALIELGYESDDRWIKSLGCQAPFA
jgi:hypothetical protein